ncbi:DNA-directed DNA polymerase [Coemansia sp. RSA 1822]|nr:DNA-directed DNA polymerase [Coemansia sp. RSA 1822]
MPTTLEFYWDLASLDEGKRIEAAAQLISALCKFQAEMPATTSVATTEEELNRICAGDVAYGIKRLIKGLASPRDGARQGYSIALSELLARVPCISVKLVLDLLWRSTEATKQMKGQEQRDMRFGRIFGLMALVQSGIITRAGTTAVEMRKIVMELAAIGAKKSYLREISYVTLTSLVPMLGKFAFRDELITMFVAVALDKGAIETPDELLLAMRLRRAYPGYDWYSALPQWQGRHMLGAKNVGRLGSVLCEQSVEHPGLFSTWHPQLHRVWDEIFDLYFNRARADEVANAMPMEFELLWERVVENGLFAPGASQFRRYWGFLLLERLLPHLSEDTVPSMMTPNIVRAMSDNISVKGKSALAKVGMRTAERLSEVCESNTKVGLAVLTHLLNQKNTIQPVDAAKTNLRSMMANRIVAKLDSEAIVGYVTYLQQLFAAPRRVRSKSGVADAQTAVNVSDKSIEKQRAWAVDQMIRVARFGQLPITDELTGSVLRFVAAHAAFTVTGDTKKCSVVELRDAPVPELSAATRDYCALALVNLVGELNRHVSEPNRTASDAETRGLAGHARDGTAWPTAALALVLDTKRKRGMQVVLHGYEETQEPLTKLLAQLREMAQAAAGLEAAAAQRVHMLELLLGNLSVGAAFGANPQTQAEYLEVAAEVSECYAKLTQTSQESDSESDDEPELQPVEVLTDILISLFTRDSSILRRLCDQVFVPFAELMTARAMESIVGVLQAREGAGEDVVTEMDGLDAMDVDESDTEMADDNDAGIVDEELRRKIEEALGSNANGDDAASESGAEESFDDEQMTVFDDKLAEIFRQKKEQKTWARELKLSFVNFKLRVLDLADVFLTRQGDNALAIQLVTALVDLARTTNKDTRNRAVHERAVSILNGRLTKIPAGFDQTEALKLLEVVHERARRASDQRELEMLGGVAAFVGRAVLESGDAQASARVHELNAESVRDFLGRKASQIQVGFFRSAMAKQRAGLLTGLWTVAADAVAEFGRPQRAVNVYRQVQAYALADAVLATAPRVASELTDLDEFTALAQRVLRESCASLQETLVFAVSDANQNATGRLHIDGARVREIVQTVLQMVRRVAKVDVFRPVVAVLKPTSEWTQAVQALEASDKLASPVVRNMSRSLANLSLLAEPKKGKKAI